MAQATFQFLKRAQVNLATFEPSCVVARDFIRTGQAKAVQQLSGFELVVRRLDSARLPPPGQDLGRSSIHVEFHDGSVADFNMNESCQGVLNRIERLAAEREVAGKK